MRIIAVLVLAAMCGGCAGAQVSANVPAALSTQAIKDDLLRQRSTLWKDPDSIRDAHIGEAYACPRHGDFSGSPTTCICIESNAKNSMGGFTGLVKKVVLYRGTTVYYIKDQDFDDRCEALVPFPEFNGGYTPPAPQVSLPPKRKRTN